MSQSKTPRGRVPDREHERPMPAPSLRSIEQLFSHPACFRSGHEPDALQQHAARAADDISASDGNVIAAMIKAVRNLRTPRL